MHHEFSHILHQTKTYPKSFDEINAANYEPNTWQDRLGGTTCSLGFTSPYASGQAREDFAETCANYIVRTPDEWELTLWLADRGWVEVDDSFITYALSDVWPGAFRDLDKTGIDDAVMKKYGFCYYYYRNQSDKDQNRKTYFGQFVEREEVYYLTNLQLTVDATGSCSTPDFEYVNDYFYYIAGGGQKFKKSQTSRPGSRPTSPTKASRYSLPQPLKRPRTAVTAATAVRLSSKRCQSHASGSHRHGASTWTPSVPSSRSVRAISISTSSSSRSTISTKSRMPSNPYVENLS